jgi:hypothetical protein
LVEKLEDIVRSKYVTAEILVLLPKGWTEKDLSQQFVDGKKQPRKSGVKNLPTDINQKLKDRTLEEIDIFNLLCPKDVLEGILSTANEENTKKTAEKKKENKEKRQLKRELKEITVDVEDIAMDKVERRV